MSLFRLDASIRIEGSVSREVADTVEKAWRGEHPHAPVVGRDLGLEPLPDVWRDAVSGWRTPAEQRTQQQADAVALSDSLVDELLDADAYLFAVPLYNYGVPQHVKAWMDLIMATPRGTSPMLAGRSGVLVLVRGGGYGPGTPREGWDHAGPYLRRILAEVWGLDLHVAEAELTLAGVVPAMESLIGLAEESRRGAHAAADGHGRTIAERVRAAA
ncbi:FMN-dependent NADH-azoreductase [Rugosimonospora africana]|uniref:FMN dependent NADH:quinone oxidoreductase n=1 Tax=Rugosimonospora africana TaxID=556532 RepID=A0A8J3QUV8_9ACTN|nr:NAD(P)H-dependent oxidoreductase [Rugosimonospora africana]GIH17925.1 FMN-dependent NADH-azoreductase [Rugosimonospora africana]